MSARTISTFVAVVAVATSLLLLPSPVSADSPVHYREFSFVVQDIVPDFCAFPITITATATGHGRDFYDKDGNLFRGSFTIHEQDTFTANGKTLVGEPYAFHLENSYDSNGNYSSIVGTGITEKVRLPDGTLFVGAGWYIRPGAGYYLTPDKGNSGNIAGFCAALAP